MRNLLLLLLSLHQVLSCKDLLLRQNSQKQLSNRKFHILSLSSLHSAGLTCGRAAYETVDDDETGERHLYLYHSISGRKGGDKSDGLGRWVVNDVLGESETALAFHNSWAVTPTLVKSLNDNSINSFWKIHNGAQWVDDVKMEITCADEQSDEPAVYFDVSGLPWRLSGFFVAQGTHLDAPVYTHIGAEDDKQKYLYKESGSKWLIGHEIGSNSGLAFTTSSKSVNSATDLVGTQWLFVTNKHPVWQPLHSQVITAADELDLYAKLRQHRLLSSSNSPTFPIIGSTLSLRNGLQMPAIGLGTGGISWEKSSEVFADALRQGYRLFDSAREYGNEKRIGDILQDDSRPIREIPLPHREEVFLISKVWPTYLGFIPTSREITKSLESFRASFVDLYLLHWPTCQKSVSWMHCETTVDQNGNWKQSWNALERAYAEGRVASIGVSNFDSNLLNHFDGFGCIRPHLVQNFAEPGKMDVNVRMWCSENEAIYMPYAHQRNLRFLSSSLKEKLQGAADKYNMSQHVIASRLFYQSGSAIIPRSSQSNHLEENLKDVIAFSLSDEEMAELGWEASSVGSRSEL